MNNPNPHWRKLLTNLGWYLATLIVLIVLLRFTRQPVMLAALWAVGVIWGGVLAFQVSRLLLGPAGSLIAEEQLQTYLDQARAYRQQIDQVIKTAPGPAGRIQLDSLAERVSTWTGSVESLVRRLSALRQDDLIRRDLQTVPQAIAGLEEQLAHETDETARRQLEHALANRRKQLEALHALQRSMQNAEIQIESTLSMLGTIYSQLLTGQSTRDETGYYRLSEEVDEEVRRLEDQLEALHEVKLGGSFE